MLEKRRIRDQRRRERRRQDPVAYAIYCEKERMRNQVRKDEGVQLKFKSSKDLTDRERRSRLKQQKQWNSNRRAKKATASSVQQAHFNEDLREDIEMVVEAGADGGEILAGTGMNQGLAGQEIGASPTDKSEQVPEKSAVDIEKLKKSIRKQKKKS